LIPSDIKLEYHENDENTAKLELEIQRRALGLEPSNLAKNIKAFEPIKDKFTSTYTSAGSKLVESKLEDVDSDMKSMVANLSSVSVSLRPLKYQGISRQSLRPYCIARVLKEERTHWGNQRNKSSHQFFSHSDTDDAGEKLLASYLPETPQPVLRSYSWKSCALVGNSAGLSVGRPYGSFIDSHSMVVRINQAPTRGFHTLVGSRTTFRLLNRQWVMGYGQKLTHRYYGNVKWRDLPLEPYVTLLATRGNSQAFKALHKVMDIERKDVKVLRLNFKLFKVVIQLLREYRECMAEFTGTGGGEKFPGGTTPSTGLMSLFLLRRECETLRLFGFGSAPLGKYQYYTLKQTERVSGDPVHSFAAEFSMIRGLSGANALSLCAPDSQRSTCLISKA